MRCACIMEMTGAPRDPESRISRVWRDQQCDDGCYLITMIIMSSAGDGLGKKNRKKKSTNSTECNNKNDPKKKEKKKKEKPRPEPSPSQPSRLRLRCFKQPTPHGVIGGYASQQPRRSNHAITVERGGINDRNPSVSRRIAS